MKYQNLGTTSKTFYGVEFKPGEIHDVPGYINSLQFIRVDEKSSTKKTADKSVAPKVEVKPAVKVGNTPADVKKCDAETEQLKPAEDPLTVPADVKPNK